MRVRRSIVPLVCAAVAALFFAGPVSDSHAATTQLFGFNEFVNPGDFAMQREINAPVRRFNVGWNEVQRTDSSTWDWTDYDRQYEAILAAGLKPLIVAVASPCWAHPSAPCAGVDPTWQPPDPAYDSAWGEFTRRLAARYPAAVAIEVWNEPNLSVSFQPHADPERYTDLLKAAYAAVKASNPAMPVISGGLVAGQGSGGSGIGEADFLERMYAAGARGAMDGIGIHTYLFAGGTRADDPAYYNPAAIRASLDRLRTVRDAAGDEATALWITEAGESTSTQDGYPPGASESQQAADLVAVVRLVKTMPDVRALVIHRLSDTTVSSGGLFGLLESGFGVLRSDGTPKAAACALSGELGGTLSCSTLLPNLPAFALGDSFTLTEDPGATTIDVLANDIDVDGGSKTIQAKTNGAHGTVAIAGGGTSLSYVPDDDYCGNDSFSYTLAGGSQATVLVTITCVDDPTVAVPDTANLTEDTPAVIPVLANDTDVDGSLNPVTSTTDGAHGSATVGPGGWSVIYYPQANYCNTDSSGSGSGPKDTFTYTLAGGSTTSVSVTVACVDDSPVAVADAATTNEDVAASIDVLANDTDVDGGPKTIQASTDGAHGEVTISPDGSSLTYTPDPGYCSGAGYDAFTYTLQGGSTTAVYVRVNCVDYSAVAVDDSATVDEDKQAAIPVLANDVGSDGGVKLIQAKTDGAHGTVAITGGGSGLSYKPQADYCNDAPSGPGAGPDDTFTYTLGGGSTATVSVVVHCLDDLATARDDTATVAEDASPTLIDVLANDTDSDGGPKSVTSATQAQHGAVSVGSDSASVSYRPSPGYCGTDTFSYMLNGGSTATVRVSVTCKAVVPPASSAPSTAIVSAPPRKTTSRKARFAFATDGGSGFTCRLDGTAEPCGSPLILHVSPGSHRLEVWATDSAGKADATPAAYQWKVKRRKRP
jgi:VCBS repeat-containing protein